MLQNSRAAIVNSLLVLVLSAVSGCDPASPPPAGAKTAAPAAIGPATAGARSGEPVSHFTPADVSATDPAAETDPDRSVHPVTNKFDIPLGNPTRSRIVVAAAALFPPEATAGSTMTIAVRVRIAAGWHVSPLATAEGAEDPTATAIDLKLPDGVEPFGAWQSPEPATLTGPQGSSLGHESDVTFTRQLQISGDQAAGTMTIRCVVTCQACNDRQCQRPSPLDLPATLEIVAPRSP